MIIDNFSVVKHKGKLPSLNTHRNHNNRVITQQILHCLRPFYFVPGYSNFQQIDNCMK